MFISYRESHILRGISYGTWYQEYSSFASLRRQQLDKKHKPECCYVGWVNAHVEIWPIHRPDQVSLGVPPLHHHCRIYTRFPWNFPVNNVLHCHIQVLLSPFQFFLAKLLIHIQVFIVFYKLARPFHSTYLNLCHEYVIIIIKTSSHLILGGLLWEF